MMENGKSPIYEPALEELMVKNMDHLYFTTDYKKAYTDADVIIIAVGTHRKRGMALPTRPMCLGWRARLRRVSARNVL